MSSRGFTLTAVLLMNPLSEDNERKSVLKNTKEYTSWIQSDCNQVEPNSFQVTATARALTNHMRTNDSKRSQTNGCIFIRPGSLWDAKELWLQLGLGCSTFDFMKGFCWAKQSICHSHQKVIYQQTACRVNRATSLWAAQSHHRQKVITISRVAQWE